MKIYKLVFTIVLSIFILLISGCGESTPSSTSSGTQTSATQTSDSTSNNSNDVALVGNVYLKNNTSSKRLLGTVRNNTNYNIQFVKVNFTFYNSSNNVIDTDFCYIEGVLHKSLDNSSSLYDTSLGKDNIGYFDCYIPDINYAKVLTKISYTNYDSVEVPNDVEVTNLDYAYDYNDNLKFTGMVKNNSSKTLSFVKIYFFITNSTGQLIDTSYSYVNGSNCGLTQTDTCLYIYEDGSFEVHSDTQYEEGLNITHRVYYDYED